MGKASGSLFVKTTFLGVFGAYVLKSEPLAFAMREGSDEKLFVASVLP